MGVGVGVGVIWTVCVASGEGRSGMSIEMAVLWSLTMLGSTWAGATLVFTRCAQVRANGCDPVAVFRDDIACRDR